MNKIKDNRNWLIVWLLTIVTFGFYSFYLTYVQIRDTNTICANDGQRTAGLFKLLILGFLTFGIYFLIWDIKLVSRWQHYAEDASEKPKYSLILHILLNYIFSFTVIAGLIGSILKLSAFNQICRIYNNGGIGKGSYLKEKNKYNPADDLWGWKDSTSSKM